MNQVILIGRVGKDPDIKKFNNGTKIASYSLATSEHYTDKKGERVEETDWHSIVCFGKLSDVIEKYVRKGVKVCVTGRIRYREYENKDGETVKVTEILQSGLELLESKPAERPTPEDYKESESNSGEVLPEDDLPF